LFLSALGSSAQSPNIIVILANDLGCRDLKLYDGWIDAPRIERMAREGMTFNDFHANSSVCSPTHAAFLTGRYQQRAGTVDNREPDQGIPASTPTHPTGGIIGEHSIKYGVRFL